LGDRGLALHGDPGDNYYTNAPEEPVSARTPIFRNIAISHVTINRCRWP